MYRIKEAFIAFWLVLTYKLYYIAAAKQTGTGPNDHARCYVSKPALRDNIFLKAVSEHSMDAYFDYHPGEDDTLLDRIEEDVATK